MRLNTSHSRPSLLMLSDRLPDPYGDSRAARAWQLLCCAVTMHQVYLSVQPDRAVNLDQWRRVADLAKRVHIESRGPRLFASSKTHQGPSAWARQRRFDALLATSPRVWPRVCPDVTGVRLCDFDGVIDRSDQRKTGSPGLLQRVVGPMLKLGQDRSRCEVALSELFTACDYTLVASETQVKHLPIHHAPAVTIPEPDGTEAWARLFREDQRLTEFVTHEVTVMPVHPVPSRKAA